MSAGGYASGGIGGSARDCQPHERRAVNQAEDSARHKERTLQEAALESLRPSVRTCESCAHYTGTNVGQLSGRCVVGELTSPINGERFGGQPDKPREWQMARELRSAPALFSTCGHYGPLWEAIF